MTDQSNNRDRLNQRRRVIKAGIIAFNLRRMTYPCMVRDLSAAGARLRVDALDSVPDTFDLMIELDGFEAECEVVWREGKEIGVRFLAEPILGAPKRKQVVEASDHSPVNSIRLAQRDRRFEAKPDGQADPSGSGSDSGGDVFRPLFEPSAQVDPDESR